MSNPELTLDRAWDEANLQEMYADVRGLARLEVIEDLTAEDFDAMMVMESGLAVCESLTNTTAVRSAVSTVMQLTEDLPPRYAKGRSESDTESVRRDDVVRKPCLGRFIRTATALKAEIAAIVENEHEYARTMHRDLIDIVDLEISNAQQLSRSNILQASIKDFFTSLAVPGDGTEQSANANERRPLVSMLEGEEEE